MVGLLLFASALQGLSPAESEAMARDFLGPERYSNRLDCVSRSRRVSDGEAPPPLDEMNTIYVFPIRPHLRRDPAERNRVTFVRTMRDGRTWLRESAIVAARLEQWPHFSARLADGDGAVAFESDPRSRGRVTLRGRHRSSHGPAFEEQGECRFVPEIPTNEAPSR